MIWLHALRVHQWIKNLLLAAPVLAAHEFADGALLLPLVLAVCAFCLCSSAVYVVNDLLDLESDRRHPHKRRRPFAAGTLPVWKGMVAAPLLTVGAFLVGQCVGASLVGVLAIYFTVALAYSLWFKRLVLVDCMMLTGLYTLRIFAGAVATGIPPSFWLLAFAIFFFLSLAFVKRYAELQVQEAAGSDRAHGRGYYISDRPLVLALGVAAAYSAVLVLALYLDGEEAVRLYARPEWLWAAVPITLSWISWVWIKAHRGEMSDDPIVFALTDPASLACGALLALTFFVAAAAP
jgi:4-hydroxybenzoate polyprenyltransferase